MKNLITIVNNYFFGKTASRKTFYSNAIEIAPNRFAFVANAALLMFLFLSIFGGQAQAASFAVNLNADAPDLILGDGVCDSNSGVGGAQCTLRAAIQEANALAGTDEVTFSLSTPNEINLSFGELSIVGSVAINGPGARNLSVQRISGGLGARVFKIQAVNSSVTISGITIAQGSLPTGSNNAEGEGGAGIQNLTGNSLSLIDVTVRNNIAGGAGGGIQNSGTLNITRSTVSSNFGTQGAGIHNTVNGTMNIINSTVSGNIGNQAVTGATQLIGGIFNLGTLTITNTTVSGNSAPLVGGVRNGGSAVANVRNTIIAGNTSNSVNPDVLGTFNSQGNNLIGIIGGGIGLTNGANGNKVGTVAAPINPQLGALQDNGGQTDTRALLAGSPAIDAGNNCVAQFFPASCLPAPFFTDQRDTGFSRQTDGDGNGTATVDIGAFEAATLAPTAAEVTVGGRVATRDGRGIRNVSVTITFPSGEQRTAVSGASGYYRFTEIPAGATYFFKVAAKRYWFSQPTQIRDVTDEMQDVDFIADAPALPPSEISPR